MSQETIHYTPADPTYITPINCPSCKGKARLVRRSPAVTGDGSGEIRTFECDACHAQSQMFIGDDNPPEGSATIG
jgi:hypothetical protein